MADLLGRAYQVAKTYLDAARSRLEEIDARAQDELRQSLPREASSPLPPAASAPAAVDDPFARAQAKIATAQQRVAAQRQEQERRQTANDPPPALPSDPVTTAYKIIGVPAGSDIAAVRAAVDQLRARCAPTRFPAGSSEQAEAQVILQRVEEAYHVLQNALPTEPGSRFDKLEL